MTTEFDELISKYVETYSEDFYEKLLLGPLTSIYSARVKSGLTECMSYSNLLIDKFATHSMSFFHLSQGIVERRNDNSIKRSMAYDLFSVNALFRVLIETYVAFNWIYVNPKTFEEKEFRFLLWKLDGLFEKRKFEYTDDIKKEAADILKKDEEDKKSAIEQLLKNGFYKLLTKQEIDKVFDSTKNKAIWKYELKEGYQLRQLKIIEVIQMICRTDSFLNMYRYSSLYTHSNFVSVDKFREVRGKPVSDNYAQPPIILAIFLTALLIEDMCITDSYAAIAFSELESYFQRFITKMNSSIKNIPIRPVR